jgi:hypothetical protein
VIEGMRESLISSLFRTNNIWCRIGDCGSFKMSNGFKSLESLIHSKDPVSIVFATNQFSSQHIENLFNHGYTRKGGALLLLLSVNKSAAELVWYYLSKLQTSGMHKMHICISAKERRPRTWELLEPTSGTVWRTIIGIHDTAPGEKALAV